MDRGEITLPFDANIIKFILFYRMYISIVMKIYLEGIFNIISEYYNILSINFISLRKYSESGKRTIVTMIFIIIKHSRAFQIPRAS